MNAIDLLIEQHMEVKSLFVEIDQVDDDDDEKQALFDELADNLVAHATIEERIFYPAAYADGTKERLCDAVEEHVAIKRVIDDLLGMMPDDTEFDTRLDALAAQVERHFAEEERELFEAVRQELGAEELDALGEQMQKLFEREMGDEPSLTVPEQISATPPQSR